MKKLISALLAVIFSIASTVCLAANAIVIYNSEGDLYKEWSEFNEYFEGDGIIFRNTESSSTVVKYIGVDKISGKEYTYYCPMGYDLSLYVDINKAESALLEEYILTDLSDITLEETEEGMRLIYKETLSFDEQFEIAKMIKSNTGLIAYSVVAATTLEMSILGDVNSDNAITASDAAMVLSYYAQGQTSTAPASAESDVDYSIIADYNNDGAVTAVDAALILSDYAEGQIS